MARTATTRKATARTRKSRKQFAALAAAYGPDTHGEALPEPTTKDEVKQKAKDARYLERQKAHTFQSKVEASKVYRRALEKFKNCTAVAWMILHEGRGTVTYANSYGPKGSDETTPRASYKPEQYTYPAKEKVIAKKMETYAEVDPDEWPAWIIPAPAKRTRKAK